MFKPHKTTLSNGLRIITVPMKDTKTVTVLTLVETGTLYEKKNVNGISHFLEHLCFKGTEKRPTALSIALEFDSIGADNNAFTDYHYTGYYAKARAKHFEHILDIVSDVYLNPTLPQKEIEKEKGVIIEEINMYEDTPQHSVHDLFNTVLHGNQPAGWNILGTKESIKRMKRKDIVAYRKQHYVADATIVLVAGGVTHGKAVASIKKAFKDIPTSRKTKRIKTNVHQKTAHVASHYKKTDQTHFVLGFRSFKVDDRRKIGARLLATLLGQGMSSRLWQKLREEMGVCYYVGSYNESSFDTGVFKIISGANTKRLEEVLGVILSELTKLKETLVSKEELDKAKEYIIGGIEMGLESSNDVANFYGIQEIFYKKLRQPEELIADIKAVTMEDVKEVAQEIFVLEKLNLALIGPLRSTKKIKKILSV